jgi:hypothetical protein
MSSPPGTMINMLMDRIVQKIQEPTNREKIQKQMVDPLFKYILNYMFPYIALICITFLIIVLMSTTSVILLVLKLYTPMASMATPIATPIATSIATPIATPIATSIATPIATPMATSLSEPIAALAESLINTTP